MKGKFIVLEGIDGAGCETQAKMLVSYLISQDKEAILIDYPDYKNPIGNIIYDFLHGKHEFTPEMQLLLYGSDMLKDKNKIIQALKEGKYVIANRYYTSTLAYQCMQTFPLDKALKFAKLFEMPRPDIILFLKTSTGTGVKRKMKEKNNLDKHESNEKFLGKVARFYNKLIKERVFGEWTVIDGEQDIDSVFGSVIKGLRL